MPDIAQHLPQQTKTVEAIYAHHEKVGDSQLARGYLGASIIGHPCERYLWYCFRQCCTPNISGRVYRLFQTGDLAELRFASELGHIGCTVHTLDENDEQFAVSALGGHFSGHMDGCALGIPEAPKTWHVLEFKTHNNKSFNELKKKGIQIAKLQHYDQMQIYMHLSGMKRALYLAVNKDTDELYSERIRYGKTEAEALMDRAGRIITTTSPPNRISERRDYYQCGWCDAKEICWGSEKSALSVQSLSCRQCCHATPIIESEGARWKCEKFDIGVEGVCDYHLILPGLIAFAEPSNAGDDFIEFINNDGTGTWRHGKGGFSSEELCKLPATLLTNEVVKDVKDVFKCKVIDCTENLLNRYPKAGVIWKGPVDSIEVAWEKKFQEKLTSLTPVARDIEPEYKAIEFAGGRVAILWTTDQTAEIRERKE